MHIRINYTFNSCSVGVCSDMALTSPELLCGRPGVGVCRIIGHTLMAYAFSICGT